MNIITQIRILRENYTPLTSLKTNVTPGHDADRDNFGQVKSKDKFKLPNNPLPHNHILNFKKAENILIQGDIGTGKTTILMNIQDSLLSYQQFLNTGVSAHTKGYSFYSNNSSRKLLLFTEWQRINTFSLFSDFKDCDFIQSNYESLQKSTHFNEEREQNLIARIMRNSHANKISKKETIANLADFAKKESIEYSEAVEKYCLFVEAGLYIINQNSPEASFGMYELKFDNSIDPKQIKAKYINFYNISGEGLSQGQKTMQVLEQTRKESTDLSLTLLDEPTNSLPDSKIFDVANIIKNIKGQKFIATHNTKLIESFPTNLLGPDNLRITFYENPVVVKYI